MSDMKRVQLILEEWQQTWLAEESKRQSISMSALLRQMMTEAIELRRAGSLADDPLWGAIGLGFGPRDGVTSENLDTFLYGIAANTRSAYPLRMAAESPAEFITETSTEGESHVSGDR
ncbi:MAG: hypothetical protein KBG20_09950 [Caldilineaceae bacterium]|nr:hypothetical protein [Caldilineaceae bacterium]MBP8107084.1 hypothetical protein [Caldilineaceae bacterium]MBP8124678.1 hypothetical protein [Caldilineaceae bacterium]MBP9072613.1 hypothetical protein [Caldilineaceae bacterium]